MTRDYSEDDISLRFFQKDVQESTSSSLKKDALAGLAVALVSVPQAMAFSLVANLPVSCGILAAIFATLISGIFGASRLMIVGPNTAMAILMQVGTSEVLYTWFRDLTGVQKELIALQIVTQLSLLVGFLQLIASLFKLGRLTQFVSHSVLLGYLVGTAFAVVLSQLYIVLGIPIPQDSGSLYERSIYLLTQASNIHWPSLLVGFGSLLCLVSIQKLNRNIPAAAIMLILATVVIHLIGLGNNSSWFSLFHPAAQHNVTLVGNVGELQMSLPPFTIPLFNPSLVNKLLPIAFAMMLLSTLETTAVAKSLAGNSGQRVSINQEMFGLGLSNLFLAVVGAPPAAGSPSRSAFLQQSGGITRFAAIFSAGFVMIIVLSFGFFISLIPLASLAPILILSSINSVNLRQFFLCFKATRSDSFVLLATIGACILFSLDIAFYIGIVLSITLYLKKSSTPQLVEYTIDETNKLIPLDTHSKKKHYPIRIINVQGELFFGAAEIFGGALKTIAEDDSSTRVIILRLKNARDIDATACLALEQLYNHLKQSNRHLLACGLTYPNWLVLCDSGVVEHIGKQNLFILDENAPHITLHRALFRARELLTHQENAKENVKPNELLIATAR